jgi:bifunctional UDP-N-acetylglucosamine pyrophosphorylase/glucosamine-1-phosphate N-acetyltransferase
LKLNVAVLAAGKGTRMKSSLPKVLHRLAGKPLLFHVLDTARSLGCKNLEVVIGFGAEQVEEALANQDVHVVLQREQLGTAHAVQQTMEYLEDDAVLIVLYGDAPLIKAATLQSLVAQVDDNSMSVLTCIVKNPTGLGRIIRNERGQITRIAEEKDATDEEKRVDEINTGFMAIPVRRLKDWLPQISANNAQKEFYLTDLVEVALANGANVHTACCSDEQEVAGINDRVQLAALERKYQQDMTEDLMRSGVTMIDPARVDIRGNVVAAQDVEIDVNVILEGDISIGSGVKIGAGCILKNCRIGENTSVQPYTVIEDAVIGTQCQVGPFARIRPGTELKNAAKIGNFVEVKKSLIGEGSKVNHLSYVGDSELGSDVNVGAGTITCNYDGINKYKTTIGNGVFIGSNAVLVAPVTLEDNAFVAAGSTITKTVPSNQLGVGRSRQTNIDCWKRPDTRNK